jgi:hypothetical protein
MPPNQIVHCEAVRRAVLCLIPCAAALFVSANTLPGDFVLDDATIRDHQDDLERLDLRRLFFLDYWSPSRMDTGFRPLTFLTCAANFRLGAAAWSFHAVNVALHAALAALVYFLLLELLGDAVLAAAGAALHAVLPIRTEAVASIAGRAAQLRQPGA